MDNIKVIINYENTGDDMTPKNIILVNTEDSIGDIQGEVDRYREDEDIEDSSIESVLKVLGYKFTIVKEYGCTDDNYGFVAME